MSPRIPLALAAVAVTLAATGTGTASATPVGSQVLTHYGPDNSEIQVVSNPDAAGTRYVAGNFSAFNALETGGGPVASLTDGTINAAFPKVDGEIKTSVGDGSGGYYIGGYFNKVAGINHKYLAHINADGSVDSWAPTFPNYQYVYSLALSGTTLYVGGIFTSVNSQTRTRLAAFDTSDGTLTPWAPTADSTVYGLDVSGSTVYMVGWFGKLNGSWRSSCGAVGTDGTLSSWDPQCSSSTYTVKVDGSTVYLGGYFTSLKGQARKNLGAVGTDGTLSSWNPGVDTNGVFSIDTSGSTVYIGGGFSKVGGDDHRCAAAIGTDGNVKSWDPGISYCSNIYAIQVTGSNVLIGGSNVVLTGDTTNNYNAFEVEATTGARVTSFDPDLRGNVSTLLKVGDNLLMGGDSITAGGIPRRGLAAIDKSGQVTSWNPGLGGTAAALRVSGSTVYVGGSFNKVGGLDRANLAAIGTDGSVLGWNPSTDGTVNSIALKDSAVYIGGGFKQAGGSERFSAAAIGTDGSLLPWNPTVLSGRAVAAHDGTCDGEYNYYTYSYDPSYPCTIPAVPAQEGNVQSIAIKGSTVYLGGGFVSVGDQDRSNLAAVGTDGSVAAFNPSPDSQVMALATLGTKVYFGGYFQNVAGSTHNWAAAADPDGSVTSWSPQLNGPVLALATTKSRVFVGGSFDSAGGSTRKMLAAFGSDGNLLPGWDLDTNAPDSVRVNALDASGGSLMVGGRFGWLCTTINENDTTGSALTRLNTFDGAWYSPDLAAPSAPVVTRTSPASSPTTTTTATIAYSGEDGADFTCSLDEAAFAACASSPVALTGMSAGNHRFEVKATDESGNTSTAGSTSWAISAVVAVSAPTLLTPSGSTKTVVLRKLSGSSTTWAIKTGLLFSNGGDTRPAAKILTVQVAVDKDGKPVATKPSDSQALPAKASFVNGVMAWSTSGEVTRGSKDRPVWVRVGNQLGKWTRWVKLVA
ncbi:MAG: hypothetical protein WCJ63_07540 [Actinomycetes bacterium]